MPTESILAEVTGKVWKVLVTPGSEVAEEETLLIVESMKMEIPVTATSAGRVLSIEVAEGDEVSDGQKVAVIER
jgi:acetyl-CoA carboxylase biotin carboxyl carrier protein